MSVARWLGSSGSTISRGRFAGAGVALFVVKHVADRVVAAAFGKRWSLASYWVPPGSGVPLRELASADAPLLLALTALCIPFVWIGVLLTMRRLRTVGLPGWLVVHFFLPFVNVVFFFLLVALPDAPRTAPAGRAPAGEDPFASAAWALVATVPAGLLVALLAAWFLTYGWGLFVALPFVLGLVATLRYGARGERGLGPSIGVGVLANLLIGAGLLALSVEGLVCLFMAAPLALFLSGLGSLVGYGLLQRPLPPSRTAALCLLALLVPPAAVAAESAVPGAPPVFRVVTVVDVDAPPDVVWRHVVAFPDLPRPREWLFRAGIAYPIGARIEGRGVGARRECVFSTGSFVEPIEVWDEPRLLRFGVTSSPPPMTEWTPYGAGLRAPHLDGFLLARWGEFRLDPLPGGRTRLTGTTAYEHGLWPAAYWAWWSDAIIARIHLRVLTHVKRRSETAALPLPGREVLEARRPPARP